MAAFLEIVHGYGLLADIPAPGIPGSYYYATDAEAVYRDNGTSWDEQTIAVPAPLISMDDIQDVVASAPSNRDALFYATATSDWRARAATPTDISGFDTQVRTNRLDQMAAPSADVSLNSHKLTNVTDPASAQDAATKAYVDAIAQGLVWKASVRVATTANGTLATAYENGDTVDGVTLATGDRILLKNQSSQSENGIYVVAASGAPTRATDADTGAELLQAAVFVREGTANADTLWVNNVNGPITINSTSIVFVQLSTGSSVTEGSGIDITTGVVSVDIPSLTNKATPDGAADYVMIYSGADSALRKTLLDNLPGGGGASDAVDVTYDNAMSGLASTDVQAAIDELAAATGSGDFRGRITLWHDRATPVGGGASPLTHGSDANAPFGYAYMNPAADTDIFRQSFELAAGTYTLTVHGAKNAGYGKGQWKLDGTNIGSPLDWYAASLTQDAEQTITGIVVATGGKHILSHHSTTKNGSSSGDAIVLTWYSLEPE